MALVHNVCTHCRGRCLAVCSCYAESLMGACKCSEHLGAFFYSEASVAEEGEFLMFGRDCRCIYDKARLWVAASVWYFVNVFFVVYEHALALQLVCKCGRCLVIACYYKSFAYEITCNGTHANAACSYEIYGFYIFDFHLSCFIFQQVSELRRLLRRLSLACQVSLCFRRAVPVARCQLLCLQPVATTTQVRQHL